MESRNVAQKKLPCRYQSFNPKMLSLSFAEWWEKRLGHKYRSTEKKKRIRAACEASLYMTQLLG